MKKILKKIVNYGLLTVVAFSGSLFASTHSNKTFLMPRPQGVNMAMEYTTWNQLIQRDKKYHNGCNISLTSFYEQSFKANKLGKYFGISNKNSFIFGLPHVVLADRDINLGYVINYFTQDDENDYTANLKLTPKQTNYGLGLNMYQDLEEISKGLYFKLSLPFVHVKNNLNVQYSGDYNYINQYMSSFFGGSYEYKDQAGNNNYLQNQLNRAKLSPAQDKSGLADLDVILGYKLLDKPKYHFSLNAGLTIPTGNRPQGEYIFEPVYGNGGHVGVGGGLDLGIKFLGKSDWSFKFNLAGNYRYLAEGKEKRTLGLNVTYDGDDNTKNSFTKNFAHYFLLGKVGTPANTPLTPAANILTSTLRVSPASQVDAIADFEFMFGKFTFDVGYNLFWKQKEGVSLKGGSPFGSDSYGIAALDYDTSDPFTLEYAVGTLDSSAHPRALGLQDLDMSSVKTPAYWTNKIYGGLGYIFKHWENPILISVGSSYEFANNNAQIEKWALWFKAGVSF